MGSIRLLKAQVVKYKKTSADYPFINSNGTHYLNLPTQVYGGSTEGYSDDDPFTFIAKTSAWYQVNIFLRFYVDNRPTTGFPVKIRARLFNSVLNSSNVEQEQELADEFIQEDEGYASMENWEADNVSLDETGDSGSFSQMKILRAHSIIALEKGEKFRPYFILEGMATGCNVGYKGYAAIGCIGGM